MTDQLRPLWDFDDLDATEQRFQAFLASEQDTATHAEVLTQLARVCGLRDDFDQGEALIREAEALAGADTRVAVRVDLERGRLIRSGGDPERSLPLFASAFERASENGQPFIAVDAAHMAAIAAPTPETRRAWTERGIALAQSGDGSARYWLGPLLNNLGWDRFEACEYAQALEAFQLALAEREREPDDRAAIEIARYAVAKALRALGRYEEATAELEQAVAWTRAEGEPDGWFHEELAESYAALGRTAEARAHADLALPLLLEADPALEAGDERIARLRELADP